MTDPIDLESLRGPWLPTDSDMPEYLSAAKRVNLRKSAWLSSWWVGHGKDESCQIEGAPNHWFWLAYILLGLVDQKDAPYSDDAPLPFSPAYLRAALAELTARRARDAEVEALVAAATPFVALLQAHNEFDHQRNPVSGHQPVFGINDVTIRIGDLRLLRAALLPFTGDKT